MNSQELRALQEAYIQVYDEDYKPWDFGPKQNAQAKYAELAQRKAAGGSAPGTATRANKIASVGREMRTTLDKNSAATGTNPAKQGLQPATQRHTDAALRGAGGGMTASKAYVVKPLKPASKGGGSSAQGAGSPSGTGRYTPGGGQGYGISGIKLADSFDLYDIILSHLLDEGYAETLEQAEVIMVNMSEDWRESICEGAAGDVADRAAKLARQKKGQTPERKKMYQNLAALAAAREIGPFPRGDTRTGMTASDRKRRRESDAYSDSLYGDGTRTYGEGGVTKNPKKLAQQKARGQHAEAYETYEKER